MVSNFDIGDTFANGFDNPATFVTTDYWESAFRVYSRKSIGIGMTDLKPVSPLGSNLTLFVVYCQGWEGFIPQSKGF